MNALVNKISLVAIPILISLSWLLGGNLVSKVEPSALAAARVTFAAAFLFFFSNIRRDHTMWSPKSKKVWWRDQALLSVTGRAGYFFFSTLALVWITPFEAVLISTLLPIFLLFIERFAGKPFVSLQIPIFGILSCLLALASLLVMKSSANVVNGNQLNLGHLSMAFAVLLFAFHLFYYKKSIRDHSATNPLAAQFSIAAILLLPFGAAHLQQFFSLNFLEWIQFVGYAVVCNLLPFVLVHRCMKTLAPIHVAAASVLSPLFAVLFKQVYTSAAVPNSFLLLGASSLVFVLLTLRAGQSPEAQAGVSK